MIPILMSVEEESRIRAGAVVMGHTRFIACCVICKKTGLVIATRMFDAQFGFKARGWHKHYKKGWICPDCNKKLKGPK